LDAQKLCECKNDQLEFSVAGHRVEKECPLYSIQINHRRRGGMCTVMVVTKGKLRKRFKGLVTMRSVNEIHQAFLSHVK
jgi:hypothetical protein